MREKFGNRTDSELQAELSYSEPAARGQVYFACLRPEELTQAVRPEDAEWVTDLRRRTFNAQDLVHSRDTWRRFLKAFGVEDPKGDLETVVTWKSNSYWMRQREGELRLYNARAGG